MVKNGEHLSIGCSERLSVEEQDKPDEGHAALKTLQHTWMRAPPAEYHITPQCIKATSDHVTVFRDALLDSEGYRCSRGSMSC